MGWNPVPCKLYGIALASLNTPGQHRLRLKLGDKVCVLEESGDWYRGCTEGKESVRGIVPKKFLRVWKKDSPTNEERVNLQEADPLATEMTSVLREWGDIWKRLYMDGRTFEFNTLRKAIEELISWRKQIISGTLTQDQLNDVRNKIVAKINWGNRKLGLDFVPRVNDKVVGSTAIGIVHLYQVHLQASEPSGGLDSVDGSVREAVPVQSASLHLSATVRHFGLHIGEDIEMYLQIYDSAIGKYISERFLVRISKDVSFSSYLECPSNSSAIFTDVCKPEKVRDLYLVIYLIRCGRLVYNESSKKHAQYIHRRPYGCAITSLQEAYCGHDPTDADGKEFILRLYQCDDRDFSQLHELLIRKQNSKFSPLSSSNSQGVVIQLNFLNCDVSSFLLEQQSFITKSVPVRKLGFPDIIMPGDFRNDMYLTLVRGEFERGGKSSGKNVEVEVKVMLANGQVLQDAINGAVGFFCGTYSSLVLHHQNTPVWNEMLKLAVPISVMTEIHLRLEYKCCSSKEKHEPKLFGFSFLRLMDEEGTVLLDGNHELLVYKCEDTEKLADPISYLSLPSTPQELQNGSHSEYANLSCLDFSRSPKEWVVIEFQLCSTKLTQNSNLLALLKWKSYPDRVIEILTLVSRLQGDEVVKFLQDVLDALFSMFSTEDGVSTPHSGAVFIVLINVLNLLEDSRFEHFKPVVEAYINDHFSAALAYNGLARCLKYHASHLHVPERQPQIIKCFRSFDFLSRFIVQSWRLYSRALNSVECHLAMVVEDLFNSFRLMMDTTYDVDTAHDAKVVFLSAIPRAIIHFLEVIEPVMLARSVSELIDSSGATEASEKLICAKLNLLKSLIQTAMFSDREARGVILPVICHHLRLHIAARQELVLCSAILGDILNFFYGKRKELTMEKVDNVLYHDVEVLCLALIDVLVQTTLNSVDTFDPNIGLLESCFLGLLQLLDECHYERLWEDFGDRRPLKSFLYRMLTLIRHTIVTSDVIPSDWFVIRLAANSVLLQAIKECSKPLIEFFLEGGCFEPQLWNTYLCLCVTFITQPSLQCETFGETRRKMLRSVGIDMRVRLGGHLVYCWSALGDCQASFIPTMVTPFLEVTLVPEPELRNKTLGVFFEMMECEQKMRGNFKQVESELIDKLDTLVSENRGDQEYKELFNTILLEKARNSDISWRSHCTTFISSLTRLLERLLDYRMVLYGDDNLNKRMSCTYNLLNFYRDEIDRREMYVRYIYKLHDLHTIAENYIEAGLTLLQYAQMLSWSNTVLPSDGKRPEEVEWKRKEDIFLQIIEYFDKGKAWEKGISLCEELTEFYKKKMVDVAKIPVTLRMQAAFYEKIIAEVRPEPEFFGVGFYGTGYPPFVRNKLFVYRGLEYERISAFTQRLLSEYPSARLLTKVGFPGDSVTQSDQQHLQIFNVKPLRDENTPERVYRLDKARSYLAVQNVKRFLFDRPVRKGGADKDNEFKNLWIERSTLTIASVLPGVLRWFEVVDTKVEEIPPIQVACETVAHASEELETLIAVYSNEGNSSISPLTMRLQGMIDAAVMGGIAKYQEAFLTPEFRMTSPQFLDKVSQLKQLISEQFRLLEAGLTLHARLAPPEVQPLHNRLVECLAKTRVHMRESGIALASGSGHRRADSDAGVEYRPHGNIIDAPLPPRPHDNRKPTRSATVMLHPYNSQSSSLVDRLTDVQDDIYTQPNEVEETYNYMMRSSTNWTNVTGSSPQTRSPARQNASDYMIFTPLQNRNTTEPETVSLADSGIVSMNGEGSRSLRCSFEASRLTPEPTCGTPPPLPPRPLRDDDDDDCQALGSSSNPPRLLPKRTPRKALAVSLTCQPRLQSTTPPPLPPKTQGSTTPKNNLGSSANQRRFDYDSVSTSSSTCELRKSD